MRRQMIPTLLLVAFAVQCFSSMRLKSATYDEPTYLASGYVGLTTGVELNPIAPPLMKYLIAVPLVLLGSSSAASIPRWDNAFRERRTYSMSFLFANRVDADTLLFAGRSAVVLTSLLLGVLVWRWARQLYGSGAAMVALGLYAFCPNIIAHSTLATLDLGVTAGVAVASYALWRACTRPTWWTGTQAGVALSVALLMKSTAVLLLAVLPLQLGAAIVRQRNARVPRGSSVVGRAARRREAAKPPPPRPER